MSSASILRGRPHFETIQEMRLRKGYPSMRWRDRCHVLCLSKVHWLAEQGRLNPFGSERFYWIDAGLSYPGLFPRRYLDTPEGFDCALFGPDTLRALDARPAMLLLGMRDALDGSAMLTHHTRAGDGASWPARSEARCGRTWWAGCSAAHARQLRTSPASTTRCWRRCWPPTISAPRRTCCRSCTTAVRSATASSRSRPGTTTIPASSGPQTTPIPSTGFSSASRRSAACTASPGDAAPDVTVILNTYKRPHTLRQQYEAVVGQSCAPAEVFVWQNHPDYGQGVEVDPSTFDEDVLDRCVTVNSVNTNFGVWGRFAFALNARTTYVCVLDDDTIPGARWLENCLETMRTHRGLLGAVGIVHEDTASFAEHRRVGWCAPNQNVEAVDYVGHAWFFEREWLTRRSGASCRAANCSPTRASRTRCAPARTCTSPTHSRSISGSAPYRAAAPGDRPVPVG